MNDLVIKTVSGKLIVHRTSDGVYPEPLQDYGQQVCITHEPTETFSDCGLIEDDLLPKDSTEFMAKVNVVNHEVVVSP